MWAGSLRKIDLYLAQTRNTKAAKWFHQETLNGCKEEQRPSVIYTDKAPTYGKAIASLKRQGKLPETTEHCQIKYRNNGIEADQGKLKRLISLSFSRSQHVGTYRDLKGW